MPRAMKLDETRQEPWWAQDDPQRQMVTLVRQQYQAQNARYQTMRQYAAIYEYGWRASERLTVKDKRVDETILAFNRAQNAIDTLIAQVCSAKILPVLYTVGGTHDEQQLAKDGSRALEAICDEVDLDAVFEQTASDAARMSGSGITKVFPDFDAMDVKVKRIIPLDVLTDEAETRDGEPRCFYQRNIMDRYKAAECYGEPDKQLEGSAAVRRRAILKAPGVKTADGVDGDESLIEVFEGWHLPSRYVPEGETGSSDAEDDGDDGDEKEEKLESSDDGRKALCIEGVTLRDQEYCAPGFPFVFYTPKRATIGFWGIPLMRILAAGQRESELLDQSFQIAHRLIGGTHLLIPKGSNVAVSKINNGRGTKIEYDGPQPPTEWTPQPVHPQQYQYQDGIEARMLRFSGQNSLAAQGQLPQGLESGRAIKSFVGEGARYIGNYLRERERWVKRVAELILDAIGELVKRRPNLTVRLRDGEGYKTLEWKRILELRHKMVLRTTPINALSTSWAGRQDTIDSWFNSGAIDGDTWRKLADVPDLRAQNAYDMSWEELAQQKLDRMIRTGKYEGPSPFAPLPKQKICAGKFHDMAEGQGVDEGPLRLIRRFIADCDVMANPQKAEPGGPGGMPTDGPPPGAQGPGGPEQGPGGPGQMAPPGMSGQAPMGAPAGAGNVQPMGGMPMAA